MKLGLGLLDTPVDLRAKHQASLAEQNMDRECGAVLYI